MRPGSSCRSHRGASRTSVATVANVKSVTSDQNTSAFAGPGKSRKLVSEMNVADQGCGVPEQLMIVGLLKPMAVR
jgi:hypothetical protein